MNIISTGIEGLLVIEPSIFEDERGYFYESYNKERFDSLWKSAGISGLNGHRSVGGYRASMYNAMPVEGVAALITFMD